MASKVKSSDAVNLDASKKSFAVFLAGEKIKVIDLIGKNGCQIS
jgi:hypothetical protein